MSKLLSAEFVRLCKSFVFKLGILFSAGSGVFMVLMRWADVRKNADEYAQLSVEYSNTDALIFVGGLYLIFAAAVVVGLFVGTEYSDGTIRNKLSAGHARRDIYLSKLIVCAAADVVIYVVYILVVLGLGQILLGGTTFHVKEILVFGAAGITAMLAMTALLLLFSMSIQSKASGSVVCLLSAIILLFAALIIYQRLEAPEYYEAYSYVDEETGETIEVEREKNDRYLSGRKREVYEFLYNFLPVSQLYQIAMNEPDNLKLMVVYDFVIVVITTGVGIAIFKKKNIK
ncbi:ABC transporter permease [Dorea acetigenes]|uniref:ABC transporter permease n=1 Tax=Dorea acetigenes TaxID=2981787 RepID=A0ABT2RMQ8_9FIRM|nr:ABC transporter permease subunit [Dorea acetigenes]MCB6414617.1 ABC transporter permease [Faecalimonas umbilicata]MCU6686693.1 ABC transporter permease [Dorea acetigenes]SCJ06958.1 Uncharacterized protein conserved in bacteria [uncultured Clostridium sp.]